MRSSPILRLLGLSTQGLGMGGSFTVRMRGRVGTKLLASPGWTRSRWCKHSLLHQAATYVRCGVENIYSYRENRRLNRSARNEANRTARQSLKTDRLRSGCKEN